MTSMQKLNSHFYANQNLDPDNLVHDGICMLLVLFFFCTEVHVQSNVFLLCMYSASCSLTCSQRF